MGKDEGVEGEVVEGGNVMTSSGDVVSLGKAEVRVEEWGGTEM